MADEKPKEVSIWDFITRNRPKTSGAGTRLLMGEEKTDSEKLNEAFKVLLEASKTNPQDPSGSLGILGATKSDIDYSQLLKWLQELPTVKEAAQKKAAETNQVDEAAANEWFKAHWKDRTCTICKEVTWAMAPEFAHVPLARIRVGQVGGAFVRSFPSVVLTCRVCGNTLFFNANVMKLLPEGSE